MCQEKLEKLRNVHQAASLQPRIFFGYTPEMVVESHHWDGVWDLPFVSIVRYIHKTRNPSDKLHHRDHQKRGVHIPHSSTDLNERLNLWINKSLEVVSERSLQTKHHYKLNITGHQASELSSLDSHELFPKCRQDLHSSRYVPILSIILWQLLKQVDAKSMAGAHHGSQVNHGTS